MMSYLTPGERRRSATITVTEPCIHGLDHAHADCPGPVVTTIPFPRNPAQIPIAIAGALQEEDEPAEPDRGTIAVPDPTTEAQPAPLNTNRLRRTDIMTTLKQRAQKDWGLWLVYAAHALIVWPIQYLVVAPIVTMTLWSWTAIKAVFKVGGIAIVLLFVPIIGWIILAAWLIVRSSDQKDERRHVETMAALGVQYAEPEPQEPLWRTIWTPWKFGI